MKSIRRRGVSTAVIAFAGLNVFAAATPALAQQAAREAVADDEVVVVTGYRASLQNATREKQNSVGFSDSIFAEDIGKFPDLNIAESLTRVPGIQLGRDATGEGLTISIRGLGTNFTKVTLNGSQIALATPGGIDGGEQNREVDLDMFPTEFFTRLDVSKSPTASQLEGGVSGNVNLRSARAFDNKGKHLTYQGQYGYNDSGENWSPRGALIGSWTSEDDKWGVLVGVQGVHLNSTIKGYETIGWTNASTGGTSNFACTGCSTAFGGNNYFIAPTVPTNAGAGLVTGTVVDDAFLLANNPGTSLQQLSDGLIPRLGREQYLDGTRDRLSGILSMQYRPTDNLEFYVDVLGAKVDREFYRTSANWVVRNSNFMVPINVQVDGNNVVTQGTFANAAWFIEDRHFIEEADMINVNPGGQWRHSDWLVVDFQANYNHSVYYRDAPTVLFNTKPYSGVVVNYQNNGEPFPDQSTTVDLNNPANFSWLGMSVDNATRAFTTGLGNNGRVNVQNEKRKTSVYGAHLDARFGDDDNNVKVGLAYDDFERTISGRDNSQAWQNFTCGGGIPVALTSGNPNCTGSAGSAVTDAALASFLQPGPAGWVAVDWDRFKAATNYDFYTNTAPEGNSVSTGNSTGGVAEANTGIYIEANGTTAVAGRELKFNLGTRYVYTDQEIFGPVTIGTTRQYQSLYRSYDAFLPSFNAAYKVRDNLIVRTSASRTMTRPNPSSMLPNTVFSDPSAQTATQGNANIAPFLSTNFDLGGEWYTGGEGYFGITLFNKQITGFTVLGTSTIPFLQLGIPFDQLAPNQQTAILSRGGPSVAQVTVNQQVNAGGVLKINGYELNWVQPLDILTEGLGFSANYTNVDQSGDGAGAPAVAIGVSPVTYNFTGYYERFGGSVRASYTYQDDQIISGPGQNGVVPAQLRSDGRGQWDLSASYTFENLPSSPALTLNVINLTDEPLRTTFEYSNATFNYREPGRQVLFGIRGTF